MVPFPKNRKRGFVFLALVLAFVGLAVGLGVGLSNKSSSKKPLPSSTNPTTASLESVCSDAGDLDACRSACEAVMCCFEAPTDESCLDEESSCEHYEPCSVLMEDDGGNDGIATASESTVQEPSEEVQTVCNGEYNAELTCEKVCEPASCCPEWSGEDSCYVGNEEICDMWTAAGCFNFAVNEQDPEDNTTDTDDVFQFGGYNNTDGVLQQPTLLVKSVCNGEYNVELTCEEVCEPASCCAEWLEEGSCYVGNKEVCDLWTAVGCFNILVNMEEP
jgi:hypothetical protein